MRLTPSLLAAGFALAASHLFAFTAPPEGTVHADFDRRQSELPAAPASALSAARLESLLGVPVRLTMDPIRGVPKSLMPEDPAQFLTAASSEEPETIARRFLSERRDLYGLAAEEVQALVLETSYETRHNGLRHLWFQQRVAGRKVYGGRIGVNLSRDGRILNVNAGPYVAGLSGAARPFLPAGQAVLLAADSIGAAYLAGEPLEVLEDGETSLLFASGPFRAPIPAELVYFPVRDGARLAWHVILDSSQYPAMYEVVIDAESGADLMRFNLTQYAQTAQAYPVHPEQTPTIVNYDLRASAHPESPLGWVSAGSQVTASNNVAAHEDPGPPTNVTCTNPQPQGPIFLDVPPSPTQDFIYPIDLGQAPDQYIPFAIANLFVINNFYHDHLYVLGFDEPAGNFQLDNRGLGGAGNDRVDAQAQDKRSCGNANNANFSTPADGSSGRMQMFVWSGPTPDRDGDLDGDIIIHEYTHGLSNRLVGGPACVGGCALGSPQSGGMGESWGDQMAASISDDDGVGEYSTEDPIGIRNYRFGSSPLTFADLGQVIGPDQCQVHADGEVWSAMIWEIRENFIAYYGKPVGVPKHERYLLDSMKVMAFPPSFLDAKAGMILATGSNTVDRCLMEFGFAKRGMGQGASSTGNACPTPATPVTESFTPPATCNCVAPATPGSFTAMATAPNQVTLNWAASTGAVAYIIERAFDATCAGSPTWQRLVKVDAPATSYIDTNALQGGYDYAYRVLAEGQWGTFCLAAPLCSRATATGNCTLKPAFAGINDVSADGDCGLTVSWAAAASACPLASTITYDVWRSTSLPVDTSAAPLARVTGTSFTDPRLASGTGYWYLVRAEDATTGNEGPAGGNLDDTQIFAGAVAGVRTANVVNHDFEAGTDQGWGPSTTACGATTTGAWERADPFGTVQFGQAVPEDCRTPGGRLCWLTQNCTAPGCGVGAADIDASTQVLTSPPFDCTGGPRCFASFWMWYYYSQSVPGARALVEASSDGSTWVVLQDLEAARAAGAMTARWNRYEYDLSTVPGLGLSANMRLRFTAEDCVATIVEAVLDDFRVDVGEDCAGCVPGSPDVVRNRLFAAHDASRRPFFVWSAFGPNGGSWNLHTTPDPTRVANLYSDMLSVVATADSKRVVDTASAFPDGFYQVYGADNCTGESVP